jgi:sugar lactone lactonase YvrE
VTKAAAIRVLASGLSFLEGPRWHGGKLYASDFFTGRVFEFDTNGKMRQVCQVPGHASGLGFVDESLLVVSAIDRKLLRCDQGILKEVVDLSLLLPGYANDMLVDSTGSAYIGNFGWDTDASSQIQPTCVVKVDSVGNGAIVADGLVFPNGMVSLDRERTLLIAETFAARISAFRRIADGSLRDRRVWADFGGGPFETIPRALECGRPLPDGMTVDATGAVWIGDAAGRGALRVMEGGKILQRIDTSPLSVFAVALGGPEGRTLFMCAGAPLLSIDPSKDFRSCLLACEVDVPAAPSGNP